MKVFVTNQFNGHWPVGTAASVVAPDVVTACMLLEAKLAEIGLSQPVDQNDFTELDLGQAGVVILCDGDC